MRRSGPPPRRERGRRRPLAYVAGGVAAIVLVWFLWSLFQPLAGSGHGSVTVEIPRGSSVSAIGDRLVRDGVISSSFFFEARLTLDGHRGDLKSGTYELKRDMSYGDAIGVLVKGPAPNVVNVTIPEGRSRAEIARSVAGAGLTGSYLEASRRSPQLDPAAYGARAARDLEGFLFPNTYQLKRHAPAAALVTKQLQAFKAAFAKVDLTSARTVHHLTAYDVVTIASLIEREAEVPAERPLIASVVYNRLRAGMPLQIDATNRFLSGNWTSPLTQSELSSPSPYNTRIHVGLPPGPIGNPGLSSLEAAAHPASTTYLYYVANPCKPGTHSFSSTAAQFNQDALRYKHARDRAGGNAPTGC